MPENALLRTPLYEAHIALRARMVPFAGFEMPVQYSGVLEEARTVRTTGGIFDVSHMGQCHVRGPGAVDFLQRMTTNDVSRIVDGQAQYSILCNEEGGVIDDIIIYRRSQEHFYICLNASNTKTDLDWFAKNKPPSVSIDDVSEKTALIAIQGPLAERLIVDAGGCESARSLRYYWASETKVFGISCFLSRTGYTGEDGFEVYLDASDAESFWTKLYAAAGPLGIVAAGLGSRDTLRTEMGYPLHGHEISPSISPLTAGLGWVVKLKKTADFFGKAALLRQADAGPKQCLVGLKILDRRIARSGYRVARSPGIFCGTITSGTQSPTLNAPVALALVDVSEKATANFLVEVRSDFVSAEKTAIPMVAPKTKRSTPAI